MPLRTRTRRPTTTSKRTVKKATTPKKTVHRIPKRKVEEVDIVDSDIAANPGPVNGAPEPGPNTELKLAALDRALGWASLASANANPPAAAKVVETAKAFEDYLEGKEKTSSTKSASSPKAKVAPKKEEAAAPSNDGEVKKPRAPRPSEIRKKQEREEARAAQSKAKQMAADAVKNAKAAGATK